MGRDAPPGEWNYIEFPNAHCRSGSPAGIGVRYGTVDRLMIFFEGGGACFNGFTCLSNPGSYGAMSFNQWTPGGGHNGIFNPDEGDNPVADWHHIYVPYCTGDVHAGSNPNGNVNGKQEFVGYMNVAEFLDRIVPTFLGAVDHVLVTGQSAGGFGAAVNYDRIADAFPGIGVTLVDDSGPPMADAYMAACLQNTWRELWGLSDTFPPECTECFPQDGGGISELAKYIGAKHASQRLGLISASEDNVIRLFFGYGYTGFNDNNGCDTLIPTQQDPAFFEDGLYDLRDNVIGDAPTWGSFIINSQNHTWIGGGGFYDTEVNGVVLSDWVSDLIDGQASHVAP
ncbi:MAG: hypothetical protein KC636_19370 [Myxococcales bacterium]|nr:hypothetical protein [Myxococcales bacterium]